MTKDLLKRHFKYESGHLWWQLPTNRRIKVNQPYGFINNLGYISGRFLNKGYLEHRLIWLYHYGEWPTLQIDHINGIRNDNRIENLREVTNQQNQYNRKPNKVSSSIFKGVGLTADGRWRARIAIGGKVNYLGVFSSELEAAEAYEKASIELQGTHRRNSYG